jgi:hypothetical protein
MTPDELRQQLELKIVEMIKARLADGSMTEERAQQLSQLVLEALQPGMTFEELYRVIPKLDDNAPEFSPIILPILEEYEKNINQKAMESVRELIKQGQYDAAAKLGKQAINQEVKLVWGSSSEHKKPA